MVATSRDKHCAPHGAKQRHYRLISALPPAKQKNIFNPLVFLLAHDAFIKEGGKQMRRAGGLEATRRVRMAYPDAQSIVTPDND